ncbi:hypothetical protein HJC99_05570 [Candidatus Saccharibacteria bacterium]|nr:hypothetical protein [Candidatus Saccharibacteria bacterium]
MSRSFFKYPAVVMLAVALTVGLGACDTHLPPTPSPVTSTSHVADSLVKVVPNTTVVPQTKLSPHTGYNVSAPRALGGTTPFMRSPTPDPCGSAKNVVLTYLKFEWTNPVNPIAVTVTSSGSLRSYMLRGAGGVVVEHQTPTQVNEVPQGKDVAWYYPQDSHPVGLTIIAPDGTSAGYSQFPAGLSFSSSARPWIVKICASLGLKRTQG